MPKNYSYICAYVLALCSICIGANGLYQVYKKPTEVYSAFDGRSLNPQETWSAYGKYFHRYSTPATPAWFLAALAQVESSGRSWASPDWRFSLKKGYGPPTTAVGLMQFTRGTFASARYFCVRAHRVVESTAWNPPRGCGNPIFKMRLFAPHAIEAAAGYLTSHVNKLTRVHGSKSHQRLAAVIHLCGLAYGHRYLAGKITRKTRCGRHRVWHYLTKIGKYSAIFQKYTRANRLAWR